MTENWTFGHNVERIYYYGFVMHDNCRVSVHDNFMLHNLCNLQEFKCKLLFFFELVGSGGQFFTRKVGNAYTSDCGPFTGWILI